MNLYLLQRHAGVMRGWADALCLSAIAILLLFAICDIADLMYVSEEQVSGEILDVAVDRNLSGYVSFRVTLDLDNGSVVICPARSDMYGGTLYRLFRNRKPELPRLRETARVQVGRLSGSVMCRGLAMAESNHTDG